MLLSMFPFWLVNLHKVESAVLVSIFIEKPHALQTDDILFVVYLYCTADDIRNYYKSQNIQIKLNICHSYYKINIQT